MTYKFDPTILRAYDIRGIVDETLTEEMAEHLGGVFAVWLEKNGYGNTVAVGYDGRLHSPRMATALIKGLVDGGCVVTNTGLGPTPQLYYAVKHLGTEAGIMITGSHNPPNYNGFKTMLKNRAFFGDDIQELADLAPQLKEGGKSSSNELSDSYVNRLTKDINFGSHDLKVVWDNGNGAGGEALKKLIKNIPGQHELLFADIDGHFPNHHPDPTVEANLVDLKEAVAKHKADLGIAFDGDADRIGVIDGQGRVLWGDQLLALYGEELLKTDPGQTIIADVKASQVLFDHIKSKGGNPVIWKTGHSLIKSKMAETGSPLAGEMSGHVFFADKYYGFDDALYAGVRLIEILSNRQESLADFHDRLPKTHTTPELRMECDEAVKFPAVEKLQQQLKHDGIPFSDVDGVRVMPQDVPGGWWLVRASNTQAVIVARAEAQTAEGLEVLKEQIKTYLSRVGLDVDLENTAGH